MPLVARRRCSVAAALAVAFLSCAGFAAHAQSAGDKPAGQASPAPAAAPSKPADAKPADAKPAAAQAHPAPSTPGQPAQNPPASSPAEAKPATPAGEQPKTAEAKDAFGEPMTLTAKNIVAAKGTANWDSAFDTIVKALKSVQAALDKAGVKPSGPALVIYTSTDDTGFTFQAGLPVDDIPATLPKDVTKGLSPAGKVLKFVHRGSYDNMDNTYEAITNHLDEKRLEAQDSFIEEYVTDPTRTAEDKLIINVFVPLRE